MDLRQDDQGKGGGGGGETKHPERVANFKKQKHRNRKRKVLCPVMYRSSRKSCEDESCICCAGGRGREELGVS